MSLKIILARHGQTRLNEAGVIQGRSDSLLTETGIADTLKMPHLVAHYQPRVIFSSSLGRAALSASIYSETLKIPVHFREDLVEISCGEWEGSLRADVIGPRPSIRSGWHDRPPGGESYLDRELRLSGFIQELSELPVDSAVVILAHAGLNRVLVKCLLGMEPEQALFIRFPHDTVYVIQSGSPVSWLGLSTGSGIGFLSEIQ